MVTRHCPPPIPVLLVLAMMILVASCGRSVDDDQDETTHVQTSVAQSQDASQAAPQEFISPERQAELALLETKIMVAPGGRYTIAGEDADETALRAHLRQRARINRHATLTLHIPKSVRATDATRVFDMIQTYRLTNVQVSRTP